MFSLCLTASVGPIIKLMLEYLILDISLQLSYVRGSLKHLIKPFLLFVPLQVPSLMMDSQFSEFTPDITPIMLAAHTNNYEIIKLLVQRKVITQVSVCAEMAKAMCIFCFSFE